MKVLLLAIAALFGLAVGRVYYPKGYARPSRTTDHVTCDYSVDIAQALDVSYSQYGNMDAIRTTLTGAVDYLHSLIPESRFALTTFIDKPISPLGYDLGSLSDYCLDIRTTFGNTPAELQQRLAKLTAGGGLDFPEAQLEALLRTAVAPQLGWRNARKTPGGRHYVPCVLMVTDSIPHTAHAARDAVLALNAGGADLPIPVLNTLHLDSSILASNVNNACNTMEYPLPENIGEIFRERRVLPIFLLAPAAYACGSASGYCTYQALKDLAAQTGNPDYLDPMKGMVLVYERLLDKMNSIGLIFELGNGFVGFDEKFRAAIEEIGHIPEICIDPIDPTYPVRPTHPVRPTRPEKPDH